MNIVQQLDLIADLTADMIEQMRNAFGVSRRIVISAPLRIFRMMKGILLAAVTAHLTADVRCLVAM